MDKKVIIDGVNWFMEPEISNAGLALRIREHLFKKQTPYQLIEIFDTYEYGRVMTLDQLIMVTARDEYAYHEMLTHVPLLLHPNPRRVLVIGGGDGGTLREVVKHPTLEKAVQVEIDAEVVEASQRFFPELASAYNHPKVELVIADAVLWLKQTSDKFDVVLVDGSDPVGPAVGLFQSSFFESIKSVLNEGGLMSGQVGSPFYNLDRCGEVMTQLRNLFPYTGFYTAMIPAYPSGTWGFGMGSKRELSFDRSSEVRYSTFKGTLKYYNNDIHNGAFLLPENIKRAVRGN
ncbi:MAG: polyamine aminopropyltransferase [Calditrichota bacterium]